MHFYITMLYILAPICLAWPECNTTCGGGYSKSPYPAFVSDWFLPFLSRSFLYWFQAAAGFCFVVVCATLILLCKLCCIFNAGKLGSMMVGVPLILSQLARHGGLHSRLTMNNEVPVAFYVCSSFAYVSRWIYMSQFFIVLRHDDAIMWLIGNCTVWWAN